MTSRSGRVSAGTKTQHKDLYRKILLRRQLLSASEPGPAYVPFIGDGDIAAELYTDRPIFGADLDPDRVATARARLPNAHIIVADCDGWPFLSVPTPRFAIADLDPYLNPYPALEAFLSHALGTQRVVIFGTDGFRQWIMRRHGLPTLPGGQGPEISDGITLSQSRPVYNFWWARHVLPYLTKRLRPFTITWSLHYQTNNMLYWGIVVE